MKLNNLKLLIIISLVFLLFMGSYTPVLAFHSLSGKILLQVEESGEAWYIYPENLKRYYLGDPADAFSIMRELSIGISNDNFEEISEGDVPSRLLGLILLKVEDSGKAYYVNPDDASFHYLSRPLAAFNIMQELGLGVSNSDLNSIPIDNLVKDDYKVFSSSDFVDLYESLSLPNTTELESSPAIYFDQEADSRIVSIARDMDYKLQAVASTELELIKGEYLQVSAKNHFISLREAARREGYNLDIVSGYRSVEEQRNIFRYEMEKRMQEKYGRELDTDEIASGKADEIIRNILESRSIPGFSKHHSGYSVDLVDTNSNYSFTDFGKSRAYDWISKNNFFNAKRFGFIPNYPPGADDIGPKPEPWEYVYVGEKRLKR
ncbi:MAG: D-alanyl-D-alanine carboxypeptidase family protein [Parcubacteria group bacterium]